MRGASMPMIPSGVPISKRAIRGFAGARRAKPNLRAAFRDPLELQLDVVRRLEPVLRVLGEARLDDPVDGGRDHRRDLGDGSRVVSKDRAGETRLALSGEGLLSGRHLVEHGAEGEDVRSGVGLTAFELF